MFGFELGEDERVSRGSDNGGGQLHIGREVYGGLTVSGTIEGVADLLLLGVAKTMGIPPLVAAFWDRDEEGDLGVALLASARIHNPHCPD